MKNIILSPRVTGKTLFEHQNQEKMVCNEWLSSFNYNTNPKMGSTGTIVPTSHPLYLSWDEMYKIGVKIFSEGDEYDGKYLSFNGILSK